MKRVLIYVRFHALDGYQSLKKALWFEPSYLKPGNLVLIYDLLVSPDESEIEFFLYNVRLLVKNFSVSIE
jgi:hypothetical protein